MHCLTSARPRPCSSSVTALLLWSGHKLRELVRAGSGAGTAELFCLVLSVNRGNHCASASLSWSRGQPTAAERSGGRMGRDDEQTLKSHPPLPCPPPLPLATSPPPFPLPPPRLPSLPSAHRKGRKERRKEALGIGYHGDGRGGAWRWGLAVRDGAR